jgi:hypothetical protein
MKTSFRLLILTIAFSILFLTFIVMRSYESYHFDKDIGGHLKRASNANTVELAGKEMATSLSNIEKRGLVSGNTGIFLSQPVNDIEFWYENLKASHNELKEVPAEATQLEKTNILMKLRETLTDGQANSVITPEGISIYPNNKPFFVFGIFSIIGLCIFGIWYFKRKFND